MSSIIADPTSVTDPSWLDERDATSLPVVPDEFKKSPENLRSTYALISELLRDEDAECRPTTAAIQFAFELLAGTAYSLMPEDMPRGYVIDNYGGIRIEWWSGDQTCVTLVVNCAGRKGSYLFVKDGGDELGTAHKRILPDRLGYYLANMIAR